MKILTIAICMVSLFWLTGVVRAQTQDPCPKVSMAPPKHQGKYFGRGETYLIGAIVNPADPESETTATWELSPAIAYAEVDPSTMIPARKGLHYISFAATPDLQLTTIKASVKIDGLPPNCANTGTISFKVEFDRKSGRVLNEFRREMLPDLEEVNLYTLTHTLRNADDSVIALIVVNYSKTDEKQTLRDYVERVSAALVNKFNFPENKISFAFNPKDDGAVTAYGWPREIEHAWQTDIDRLEIPDSKSPTPSPPIIILGSGF